MKKFFSLLVLCCILLAVGYHLLSTSLHPMGMYLWRTITLIVCGLAGLFFLCAAFCALYDCCRKAMKGWRLQGRLQKAIARLRLRRQPPHRRIPNRC